MSIQKTYHALNGVEQAMYNCWQVLEDLRRTGITPEQVAVCVEYMDIKFNHMEEALTLAFKYNSDARKHYLKDGEEEALDENN